MSYFFHKRHIDSINQVSGQWNLQCIKNKQKSVDDKYVWKVQNKRIIKERNKMSQITNKMSRKVKDFVRLIIA